MTRKLIGIFLTFFTIGGGVALAVPSSPAIAPDPPTQTVRVVKPIIEPPSAGMTVRVVAVTVPVVEPARGVPSDPTKRCPKFEPAFRKYGLKPVKVFSYIAWRESNCRIKAINIIYDKHGKVVWSLNKNGTFDSGLLQVNSGHAQTVRRICKGDLSQLMILDCNLRVAKYLLDNGGLAHWSLGG